VVGNMKKIMELIKYYIIQIYKIYQVLINIKFKLVKEIEKNKIFNTRNL
jgi:hypothetical protein